MKQAINRVLGLGLVVALATGCAWKGGHSSEPAPGTGDGGADEAVVWKIEAERMRIYPSSRLVRQTGQTTLDARVEFFDAVGDSIKAAGNLRFELYSSSRSGSVATARLLYSWDVAMLTREQNQLYYDAVTRTYLFRLKLDEAPATGRELLLAATYMPPSGPRLEARGVLGEGELE